MAVYGRFTRTIDEGSGASRSRRTQRWYRQTAPYVSPLAYDMTYLGPLPGNRDGNLETGGYANWNAEANSRVIMNARERFFGNVGPQAQLAVGLAEFGQSFDMIEKRCLQLYRIFRAIRRRDLRSLRKEFPTSIRRIHKDFASAVLELSYGWSPLIQDIGNAVEVLQGHVADKKIFSSSGTTVVLRKSTAFENGGVRSLDISEKIGCHMRAQVQISNPNLYLANQLGFVNPASVAWELIPFSFLVDWVVPIGAFLNQWSDGFGLTLKNATTTKKSTLIYHDSYARAKPYLAFEKHQVRFAFTRQIGIASFSIPPLRFTGYSARRSLNAIALYLQALR